MAVVHDAVSESHTGAAASQSEASFSWSHVGSASIKGVQVVTVTMLSDVEHATSVTYGAVAMTAVSGGGAVDTAGEPGRSTLWELNSGIPTGTQTVVVNRTNDAVRMYAMCVSQTTDAGGTTAVHAGGIVLLEGDGALAEQSVTDGSPGTNSVRYAAGFSGILNVPAAGANSTALVSIDIGPYVAMSVRETTAGQGSRSIGFSDATSDDRAVVHWAVKEVIPGGSSPLSRIVMSHQAVHRASSH